MPVILNKTRLIDRDRIIKDIKEAFPTAKVKAGWFGNIHVGLDLDSLVIIKLSGSHAKVCGTQPLLYGLLNGSNAYGVQNDKKRSAEQHFADWLKKKYDDAFA